MTVRPNSLDDELWDVKRRLRDLETGQRIGNTTLSQGDLIVAGGDIQVQNGDIVVSGYNAAAGYTGGQILVEGSVYVLPGGHLITEGSPAPGYSNGDLIYIEEGRILFQDPGSEEYGGLYINSGVGMNTLYAYPPHNNGIVETYLALTGNNGQTPGQAFMIGKALSTVRSDLKAEMAAPIISLNCSGGRVAPYGIPGTSSAANVAVTGDSDTFSFRLVGSSVKFKQDIEPAEIDPRAVLSLEPKTWIDKAQAQTMDNPRRHIGVIAEDVQAAGLFSFVTNEDGDPSVDGEDAFGLQYDRLGTAGMLAVAKYHEERADKAEEKIDQLLKKVDTLVEYIQASDPEFTV